MAREDLEATRHIGGNGKDQQEKTAEGTLRPGEERFDGSVTYGNRFDYVIALAVTLVSGVIFTMTAGRATPFWDCGEFIACAYILGIPHPPGAALFVMMGRVASLIPFGDVAFKLNLFSSYSSALAIGFCALALARVIRRMNGREERVVDRMVIYAGTVVGSLAVAFGSTFWFNAVEAEVYGLTLLIVAILIWLSLLWIENARTPEGNRILILQAYLLFLGATNHMQAFLVIIPIFLLIFLVDRARLKSPLLWVLFFLLTTVVHSTELFLIGTPVAFALASLISYLSTAREKKRLYSLLGAFFFAAMIGYSLYTYVPIRSRQNPAIDENNPETWTNFKMFLERKQYSEKSMFELMFTRKGTWANQFGDFHRIGLWYHMKQQWLPFPPLLPLVIPVLSLIGLWALWKRDRKIALYFLLSLLLFTVAMTLYLNFSDGTKGVKLEVRDRDYFYTPGFVMIAFISGIGLSALLGLIAASRRPGRETIAGFLAVFSLIIPALSVEANYHEHDRSRFWVTEDLAYNMLVGLRENAIIFTGGDNDTFPLWYIQEVRGFRKDVRVVNLSLLNTPWYILQLKHREPKIAMGMSDEEIEALTGYYTRDGQVVTIKDRMMRPIIENNIAERPIYFAITVPTSDQEIVKDKLIQEGLVKRIEPGLDQESINVKEMEANFGEGGRYRFRGLDDPTIYKDRDTIRLLTNYNACLYNLAGLFQRSGDMEKAVYYTELLRSFPHDNLAGHRMLAMLAEGNQDWEMALDHMNRCIEIAPDDALNYVKKADYLEKLGWKEEAVTVILEARSRFPDDRTVLGSAVRILSGAGRGEEMMSHLQEWARAHPNDTRILEAIESLSRDSQAPPGPGSGGGS